MTRKPPKEIATCNLCGKACQGVSAVKAHIRTAHLKVAEENDYSTTPISEIRAPLPQPAYSPPPPTQVPGFDMGSFQKALENAMAPVMAGLRGVQQTVAERPAPPSLTTMEPTADPPPKTEEHKAEVSTAGLTEETGQKLCEGIECFRKSAEVLAEAVKDGTFFKFPQPATQPPADASGDQGAADTGSEGGEAQEGAASDAQEGGEHHTHASYEFDDATSAMRKMLNCPDGICQRAVRREVLANWPALFGTKLTIQMADEGGKSQDYFKAFAEAFATNDGTDVMPPEKEADTETTAQGEESKQDGEKEAAEEAGQQGKKEEGSAGEGSSKELKNGDSPEPTAGRRTGSLFSGI